MWLWYGGGKAYDWGCFCAFALQWQPALLNELVPTHKIPSPKNVLQRNRGEGMSILRMDAPFPEMENMGCCGLLRGK
jgi:hypothetical protein